MCAILKNGQKKTAFREESGALPKELFCCKIHIAFE